MDKPVCSCCGDEIQIESQFGLDGNNLCFSCFARTYFICSYCSRITPVHEQFNHDGEIYCEACFNEVFASCDQCREIVKQANLIIYSDKSYCPNCAQALLSHCNYCGDWFNSREEGLGGMCNFCSADHFECENCSMILSDDDYGGDGLCQDCYDERAGEIHDHDYKPNPVFHPSLQAGKLYLGVELETDDYDDWREGAKALGRFSSENEHKFYLKEDGSLRNGIEIVSHPATLKYHIESMDWPKLQKICVKNGAKSECNTCGLHVHFNVDFFEDRELAEARLLYLFEKFWGELFKFSRRQKEGDYFKRYCGIGRYEQDVNGRRKNMGEIKLDSLDTENKAMMVIQGFKCYCPDRYMAVNITNDETIEIRLFNGTLKSSRLFAALELVDIVARIVKKYSTRRLQKLSWATFMQLVAKKKYPHLKAELERLELTVREKEKVCA